MTNRFDEKAKKLIDPEKWYGTLWDEKRDEIAQALRQAEDRGLEEAAKIVMSFYDNSSQSGKWACEDLAKAIRARKESK